MSIPNFNPPAPGAINIRTFQDLRRFLLTYVVNQWMQYVNGYMGTTLVPQLNLDMGVADGSAPVPGAVGEFQFVASASPIGLVSGLVRDVVSLNLSPGDWDVTGSISTSGTSSNINDIVVWVSPQSATRPPATLGATFALTEMNFGTSSSVDTRTELTTGTARVLNTQAGTVYLSTAITFQSGTCLAAGAIRARRMR